MMMCHRQQIQQQRFGFCYCRSCVSLSSFINISATTIGTSLSSSSCNSKMIIRIRTKSNTPKAQMKTVSTTHHKQYNETLYHTYPTVRVYCNHCSIQLFKYKKKNGTKSNLIKCYIDRIIEDCIHLLRDQYYNRQTAQIPSRTTNTTIPSHHPNASRSIHHHHHYHHQQQQQQQPYTTTKKDYPAITNDYPDCEDPDDGGNNSNSQQISERLYDDTDSDDTINSSSTCTGSSSSSSSSTGVVVYYCPNCRTNIGRFAIYKNTPCIKWMGTKIRMK